MKKLMTNILNLPGVIVEDYKQTAETLILVVKSQTKTANCPCCGQCSHHLHQNYRYLVRDLPMGDREVILRVNRRRFKCKNCRKPFNERLDFLGKKKNFTNRYAQSIAEQVVHSDIKNVAKNNKLTEEEVWSMVKTVANKVLPVDVKKLQKLGIDEISLVKGQGKFIVVLVDLKTHKLIGLVSDRKQVAIEKKMLEWGEEVLNQIEEVSMDMTGNYKSLVRKLCPNANVTVDRFHVTKMIHQELNQARIDQKKASSSLKVKERAQLLDSLKGSKYTLLKLEKNLSSEQELKLKQVKNVSEILENLHILKEEFHSLFEKSNNLGDGILELTDWLKKAQPYYEKSAETIKRWFGEIVGYFESRTTNGIVEGINTKLKLLKRCGFGLRNLINFEIRALLFWHFPEKLAQ
jgi:transposase